MLGAVLSSCSSIYFVLQSSIHTNKVKCLRVHVSSSVGWLLFSFMLYKLIPKLLRTKKPKRRFGTPATHRNVLYREEWLLGRFLLLLLLLALLLRLTERVVSPEPGLLDV